MGVDTVMSSYEMMIKQIYKVMVDHYGSNAPWYAREYVKQLMDRAQCQLDLNRIICCWIEMCNCMRGITDSF